MPSEERSLEEKEKKEEQWKLEGALMSAEAARWRR
jgi:hypothetical protein